MIACLQLAAEALLLYEVDVQNFKKLTDWIPALQKVVKQKHEGTEGDRVKALIELHNHHMDETLIDEKRLGNWFQLNF